MITINEQEPCVIALRHAESKLRELATSRAAKEEKLSIATQSYMRVAQSRSRAKLDAEADELLRGQLISDKTAVQPADLERLDHEIAVLDVAMDRQKEIVDMARGKFSQAVCHANRARYVEIEKRIARAVQELALANQAEVDFIDELRDAGATPIFRPMRVNQIGIASDPQSLAAFHRKEVEQFLPEAVV
jgi:hypothetical protein